MPKYSYTAISRQGKKISGSEEATSADELAQMLRDKGYIVTSSDEGKKGGLKNMELTLPFLSKVSLSERLFFVRNLRVMLKAGVSMQQALDILVQQSENKQFQGIIREVQGEIMKGKTFSQAITAYPEVFPELFVNMVKVGEESGTLEDVFRSLEMQMEREHDLRSKVKGALIYPSVVVTAMTGVGILMLVFVVPQLAQTFDEFGVELPTTTRIVIAVADFLVAFWYIAIAGAIGFVVGLMYLLRFKEVRKIKDSILLRAPFLSRIIRQTNNALTARTLSSLTTAGVPLVRSLQITSGVVGNIHFQTALQDASVRVQKGEKLSEALGDYQHVYALLTIQMIAVGERTGQSAEILQELAEFYEEEVTNFAKNLATTIEPILMLIIGATVGFFAVSMIQPMYAMLGQI